VRLPTREELCEDAKVVIDMASLVRPLDLFDQKSVSAKQKSKRLYKRHEKSLRDRQNDVSQVDRAHGERAQKMTCQ
jgi:ElaB/YqjD/DUF883 family membrane-anchored ribosome-binding protein